jgi:hypothetical protein
LKISIIISTLIIKTKNVQQIAHPSTTEAATMDIFHAEDIFPLKKSQTPDQKHQGSVEQ